jgi:hypothetical protein
MTMRSGVLEDQRRRAGKNQSLFREVNERIEELAKGSFASFICECMNEGCDDRIELTVEEYESIRAHPNRFFIRVGHDAPEVETVVEATDRYVVVAKLGAGELVSVKLDPRGRQRALGSAERHRKAAQTHEEAASRHIEAAKFWIGHGDGVRADLEARNAELERDASQLERERAALEDPVSPE